MGARPTPLGAPPTSWAPWWPSGGHRLLYEVFRWKKIRSHLLGRNSAATRRNLGGLNLGLWRSCSAGEMIRPFCIMLLYRYLLHYGLLLHIMSQYLCLFSLILQGLHKEGECRQLGFWAGKGGNIIDLFCTAPKVLKLHGRCFPNI